MLITSGCETGRCSTVIHNDVGCVSVRIRLLQRIQRCMHYALVHFPIRTDMKHILHRICGTNNTLPQHNIHGINDCICLLT